MSNDICKCKACEVIIKLEEKFCRNCGAENVLRIKKILELESRVIKVDKRREKNWGGGTHDRRGLQRDRETESLDLALVRKSRKLRMNKTKLITGNTHKGILEWVKTQHYDLNRTIQDIAEDFGESMITIRNYLNEIEKQDIIRVRDHLAEIENQSVSKNEKNSHQEGSLD
jgi:hypothetical protein